MPLEPVRRGGTASPQVTSRSKKTSAPVPAGAPPARQMRPPTEDTFTAAYGKIKTIEDALSVLRRHEMVPAAGDPTAEGLITGLLHVGVALVGKNEWAAECCIGLAVYAKTVIEGA
ncbi:hypothetical protein BD309DRAFT_984026, partial [Dichomitus squalens]